MSVLRAVSAALTREWLATSASAPSVTNSDNRLEAFVGLPQLHSLERLRSKQKTVEYLNSC